MAKKKRGDAHGGGHGWFVTFADLMGLMMSFFVMLVAFSTMDNNKLKIVAGSMRDAFGVQSEVRYSGIVESDGLPTRPKLKNTAHIPPEESSNTPTPDEQERNRRAGARLKIDREFALASARTLLASDKFRAVAAPLQQLLRDARQNGYFGLELETRLALAQLAKRSGETASAQTQLASLKTAATARGFGRIARQAAAQS